MSRRASLSATTGVVALGLVLGLVDATPARAYSGGTLGCGASLNGSCTVVTDPRIFVVSWQPSGWASGMPGYSVPFVEKFIQHLNESTFSNLLTQYVGPDGQNVSDTVAYGGDCTPTTSASDVGDGTIFAGTSGDPITDAELVTLITGCISSQSGWGNGPSSIYLLLAPQNLYFTDPEGDASFSKICGYHWDTTPDGYTDELRYGVIASPFGSVSCDPESTVNLDAVRATAHELMETITNPKTGIYGWHESDGGDAADYCDQPTQGVWGTSQDVTLGGITYRLPGIWSNADGQCEVSYDEAQVTPAISGTRGFNGWYTSPVTVHWDERPSDVTPTCPDVHLSTDTNGTAESCTATGHDGGAFTATTTVEIDMTKPTAAAGAAPATLDDPLTVTFSEPVYNIVPGFPNPFSANNAYLTAGGALVPATVTCLDASSATVPCSTGAVSKMTLAPTIPPVTGQPYTVIFIDPGAPGALPVYDVAGNALTTTQVAVRAAPVLQATDPHLTYSWGAINDPAAKGGSYTHEQFGGATAQFSFSGTSLTWFTVTGPNQGIARVSISRPGLPPLVQNVDNYAATKTVSAKRKFALNAGSHTVIIQVTGTRNAASSRSWVSLDAFGFGGTTKVNPAAIYTWATIPDGSGGVYTFSSTPGASASAPFYGSRLDWTAFLGPNDGMARFKVDTFKTTTDLYQPSYFLGANAFTGLSAAEHTVKITVTGTKNPASSDVVVTLDHLTAGP